MTIINAKNGKFSALTRKLRFLGCGLVAMGLLVVCDLSLADDDPDYPATFDIKDLRVQPAPQVFQLQARIAQSKMPVGDVSFNEVIVVLERADKEVCRETFNNLLVRNSVLNLELGRNANCNLATQIANANGLAVKICFGGDQNCLKKIMLGTVPYALSSTFAHRAETAHRAEEAAQSHYAHRITADRDMFDSKEIGRGYFDFHTPNTSQTVADMVADIESTGQSFEGNNLTKQGYIQWTPIPSADPTEETPNVLHISAKDPSFDIPKALEALVLHAANTYAVGNFDVTADSNVYGDLSVGANAAVGGTLRVGAPTALGALSVNGATNLKGNANIEGGELNVYSDVTFHGQVNMALRWFNWRSGQPDNFDDAEHCAMMHNSEPHQWNDASCAASFKYACKSLIDGQWAITSGVGPWSHGTATCVAEFGAQYYFSAPRDEEDQAFLVEETISSYVWLNLTDSGHEGVWTEGSNIGPNDITDWAIENRHLAEDSVGSFQVDDNSITRDDIRNQTIHGAYPSSSNSDIAGETITGWNIKNETITSTDIDNNSITRDDIQNQTIYGAHSGTSSSDIASETVTGWNIKNESITGSDIDDNTVTRNDIQNQTIYGAHSGTSSSDIASETITGWNIKNNSITKDDIAGGSLTGNEVLNGSLLPRDIAWDITHYTIRGRVKKNIGNYAFCSVTGVEDFDWKGRICTAFYSDEKNGWFLSNHISPTMKRPVCQITCFGKGVSPSSFTHVNLEE